jgi:hypothetical protein
MALAPPLLLLLLLLLLHTPVKDESLLLPLVSIEGANP